MAKTSGYGRFGQCIQRRGLVFSVLALAWCAGCWGSSTPKTIPVRGKVLYQGQPVEQGYVSFVPTEPAAGYPRRPAMGTIQPDGTYQLSTFASNDGAIPGKYQVAVVSMTGGPTPEDPSATEEWLVPKKYSELAESGLTAMVPADAAGPIQLDFDLLE